ncbi:hypothetical protein VTK73DRAFT_4326 [Phialemonium thermophilum]|uniref:Uncharacterized protein n=1 Tax=Phialemonium thermophilum TaxID=223376 RepID=A0ABR3V9Q1_9PEZI
MPVDPTLLLFLVADVFPQYSTFPREPYLRHAKYARHSPIYPLKWMGTYMNTFTSSSLKTRALGPWLDHGSFEISETI